MIEYASLETGSKPVFTHDSSLAFPTLSLVIISVWKLFREGLNFWSDWINIYKEGGTMDKRESFC